jgi:hypothetical protein
LLLRQPDDKEQQPNLQEDKDWRPDRMTSPSIEISNSEPIARKSAGSTTTKKNTGYDLDQIIEEEEDQDIRPDNWDLEVAKELSRNQVRRIRPVLSTELDYNDTEESKDNF